MNKLPQEVSDIILSFVPSEDLGKYVTVSRQWQYTIELETFKSVKLKSTELDYFARVYTPKHRQAVLGPIQYEIRLPEYPLWKCTKFEKAKDQDANNEVFTEAIAGLFGILNSWEKDGSAVSRSRETPIKLRMTAMSPSDDVTMEKEIKGHLGANRWMNSLLKLLRPDDVNPVERIRKFGCSDWHDPDEQNIKEPNRRDTDALALATIAAKLPKLEVVFWSLRDKEFRGTQPRYRQRHEFGRQLAAIKNTSLKCIVISFGYDQPRNEASSIPSALHPSDQFTDPLSLSLHNLSQAPGLEYLYLGGSNKREMAISPSFFWPENSPTTPLWPSLQRVSINISNTTPSGSWYFDGDENDDLGNLSDTGNDTAISTVASEPELSEDSDTYFPDTLHPLHTALSTGERPERQFRTTLDWSLFNPLLISIAKAVLRMPVLKRFNLIMVRPNRMKQIFWSFSAQGVQVFSEYPLKSRVKTVLLVVGEQNEWTPCDDLKALWREIVGEDGLVDFWTN